MNALAPSAPADAFGHVAITPSILYVGTPVALITTLNVDGSTNISPMSSAWALADRIVLGMSGAAHGAVNALREREMVINFPHPELWRNVEALAPTTGADPVPGYKQAMGYVFEPEKFACAGLTAAPSATVKPDRIAECPLQMEAEVLAAHPPADWPAEHPAGFHILETRVSKVWADPAILIPGTQHIDTERWSPLLYVFRHYFGTGPDLGKNFRAET